MHVLAQAFFLLLLVSNIKSLETLSKKNVHLSEVGRLLKMIGHGNSCLRCTATLFNEDGVICFPAFCAGPSSLFMSLLDR